MRYLPDIIDKIVEIIPNDNEELLSQLDDYKSSASFAAPEIVFLFWRECYDVLMGYESEDWFISAMEIFAGRDKSL